MIADLEVHDHSRDDLLTLLRHRAIAATAGTLHAIVGIAAAGFLAALVFGGRRYYLALPFLAAMSFAAYGLAGHRVAASTSESDADHARAVDARIVMKTAGIIGMASAIAALLCFFILVLGPSWIS